MTAAVDPLAAASPTSRRKAEHLEHALRADVLHRRGSGLERLELVHRAIPGRDLADVSLSCTLLGARLDAPLVISSMTGGTPEAATINRRLSEAAAACGVALALGSGRALLEQERMLPTFFDHDRWPRPPLLIANLGAMQIRGEDGPEQALRLVRLLDANALYLHLNPLQEAIQPEGDTRFGGVVAAIARVVRAVDPLPVVVKEVGFGLHPSDVEQLVQAGVAAIDVAGSGGTNWALLEGMRAESARATAAAFADWGVSTTVSLTEILATGPSVPVIASGGVDNGVDAAKCLCLGASAVGIARALLASAREDRARECLTTVVRQLHIATWMTGVARVGALVRSNVRISEDRFHSALCTIVDPSATDEEED